MDRPYMTGKVVESLSGGAASWGGMYHHVALDCSLIPSTFTICYCPSSASSSSYGVKGACPLNPKAN